MNTSMLKKFALAAGTAVVLGAANQAMALPQFTYDPTGGGLSTTPPGIVADQLILSSTELIKFNPDGTASAMGYAKVNLNVGGDPAGFLAGQRLYLEFSLTTSAPTGSTGTVVTYNVNSLSFTLYQASSSTTFGTADAATGTFDGTGTYDSFGVDAVGMPVTVLSGTIFGLGTATIDSTNLAVGLSSKESTVANTQYFTQPSPFYPFAFDVFTNTTNTYSQSSASGTTYGAVNLGAGNASFTTVPEPSTIALFGIALVGMGVAARRRKN